MRRHRTHASLAVATILAAASGAAMADDAPAAAPAAPLSKWAQAMSDWGLTVSGYVAASYYVSNGYPFNIHQFDTQHDTFQLDQAGLQVAYQPKEGFGALVDVIAGEDAKILNSAEGGSGTFDIRQGYLQYATGPLTIIAGKFLTLAGAEVINPTLNTNFSRSLLFFDSEPLTHTGVRATYAVNDTINVIAGVNNGWNTTSTSYGSKTGELGVGWTPNKIFALAAQAYVGKYGATVTGTDGVRTLIDLVGTYNVTSQLTLILNFDWDQQKSGGTTGPNKDSAWDAAAFYANYAINDQWRVSGRIEYLHDKDGYVTGVSQTLKEGTVTFGYSPVKEFELRAEFRYDKAQDPNAFLRSTTGGVDTFANSLSEFALQGVYKFSST